MTDNLFEDLGISVEDPDIQDALRLAIDISRLPGLIREERLMRGLSIETVAQRMGLAEEHVRKMERPGADLHLSTIRRYAMAVGVIVRHHVYEVPVSGSGE